MQFAHELLAFFQSSDFIPTPTSNFEAAHAIMAILPIIFLFIIVAFAFVIFLVWRILTKTGMSPWLCLLLVVPLGNIILLCILAFGEWPALKKLE